MANLTLADTLVETLAEILPQMRRLRNNFPTTCIFSQFNALFMDPQVAVKVRLQINLLSKSLMIDKVLEWSLLTQQALLQVEHF